MRNSVTISVFLAMAAALLFHTAGLYNARYADGLYEEDCTFYNGLKDISARCVRLVTRDSISGDRVSITAAILTPDGHVEDAEPLLYLPGGWGRPTIPRNDYVLTEQGSLRARFAPVFESGRQLILVDLRGVGTAAPFLSCRLRTEYALRLGMPELGMRYQRELYDGFIETCLETHPLGRDWVKNFTTQRRASDLIKLRKALGIKKWHVYGASHGPRVALVLLKRDRAGLASLLMDSPDYTSGNYFAERQEAFDHRLDLLDQQCVADDICSATYPDGIVEEVVSVLGDLRTQPFVVTSPQDGRRIVVRSSMAQFQFYNMLYYPNALQPVMLLLDGLRARDPQHPSVRYITARNASSSVSSGYDWLMSWAGICGDYLAEEDTTSRYGLEMFTPRNVDYHKDVCEQLGIEQEYDLIPASNPGNVPTLVMTGKYDVITPPYYGEALAKDLGAVDHLVHPQFAHGVTFGRDTCMGKIAVSFWNNPKGPLDRQCFDEKEAEQVKSPTETAGL